jgi:hypothetical protein
MKTTFANVIFTASLAAGCLSVPVFANPSADPTSQLAAIYAKTDAALAKKDIDGSLAYHSPKFMALDTDGALQTNDQQKARLTKLFSTVSSLDVTTHIEKCDYADKTATVIITQHIKAQVIDPDSSKAIPVSGDDEARELWSKEGANWQLDVVQTLQGAHLTPDD